MAQAADMSIYCENTTLYRSSGGMSDVAKDVQGGRSGDVRRVVTR